MLELKNSLGLKLNPDNIQQLNSLEKIVDELLIQAKYE